MAFIWVAGPTMSMDWGPRIAGRVGICRELRKA